MKYTQCLFNPSENISLIKSTSNDGIVKHSHEFIELFYVSRGKGIHQIKDKSYIVSAGDIFIICTQDEHSFYSLPNESNPLEWINCIFLQEFIKFDFSIFPPEFKYINTDGFEMNYIFQSMIQEFQQKKPEYLDILRSYLMILLLKLARYIAAEESNEDYTNVKKKMLLKKAMEYIQNNYQEAINLNSIASHLTVSPSYIGKIFKELKDTSPISYLIKYRVELSSRLLINTSLPVNQIAEDCGFKDVKFYYTVFKRLMGISPREFRTKHFQLK